MRQFEKEARTVAKWYADQLRHSTTGIPHERHALDVAVAKMQASRQVSREQADAFEMALAKRIEEVLEASGGRGNIVIDYGPPQILLDAGTDAGIDLSWNQLGQKKVVSISPGSVAASGGDGQKYVELELIED